MENSDALIRQFVALGYIAEQPEDRDLAAAECIRETQWNLARVYTSTWRFSEALPLLENLCAGSPTRGDFAMALADCQLRLGLVEDAFESATAAVERYPRSPVGRFVLGQVAFTKGRFAESLAHLLEAERLGPGMAGLHCSIGLTYLRLRRWGDAERAFGQALAIDPHFALALQGLARVRLRQNKVAEAAQMALSSIGCQHDLPLSHFWLGMALLRLGQRERAIQALETSLSFQPPLRMAHRILAGVYGNTPEGKRHGQAARDFLAHSRDRERELEAVSKEARQRHAERRNAPKAAPPEAASGHLQFTVVSGLPRSGTSLMMRMLEAAGVPVMTDGRRVADSDNPEGYYEWEAIRTVATRPSVLREAEGKAIKVVSILLPSLPREYRYRVIFMDRPVAEVVRSQERMLQRGGGDSRDSSAT